MLIYMSQTDLANLLGRNPQVISWRMAHDLLPIPDIYIGNVLAGPPIPGWLPVRANMYRDWDARNSRGTSRRLSIAPDAQPPIFWDAEPEWYLSQREVGQLIGLQRASVSHRRVRGSWPVSPVVRIGLKEPGTSGWDIDPVRRYGEQGQYLNAAGQIDALRRPGPVRKALSSPGGLRAA